ncbi:MAG: HIT domain-containing protein [Pseudomonadales bacterium]|nr:histidine triad nucleotide-binding protein [Pseudomonadales bacterium]NIX09721.1 HIT domain-containing protein [Pseudomonadales bacterium]
MSSDCLFCKIASGEIPGDIVYEDDELLAFNDISPQAPHHVLVIPKQHVATVNDLSAEHADLLGRLVLRAQAIAGERGIQESGYRLILNCNGHGGQTVFHLHLHLLGGRQLMALG